MVKSGVCLAAGMEDWYRNVSFNVYPSSIQWWAEGCTADRC